MHNKINHIMALLAAVIGLTIQAQAASIPINNYNFETGDLTGWGSAGQAAAINWDAWPAYCGTWVTFLSSSGGNGVIAQNGLTTIQAGVDYQLTFYAAAASWQPSGSLAVQLSGNGVTDFATQTFTLVGGGGGGNATNWASYSLKISSSTIAANPSWIGQSLGVGFWTPNGDPVEVDMVALNAYPSTLLPINNASFEKPAIAYNGFSPSITNWSSLGDVGVQNLNGNTGWFSSIPDGNQVAQITQNGQIYQTLSCVLSPGVYDLSANVGSPTAINDARPFSLELWAGSTLIAQVADTSPVGSFPRYSTSYTASTNDPLLGQTLNIIFRGSTSGAGAWTETSVDDVELNYIASNAPPEVLIPIQNPSFENVVLSNPGAYSTNITPWIGRQPPLAADLVELSQNIVGQGWVSNDSPLPAGYNVAALSYDDSLTQTLTNNLAAGVYNLSAYVGNNTAAPTTFPFQLQLWAGNTLLSQTSAVPTGTLVQYSTSYTASNSDTNLGTPLKIVFKASIGEDYGTFDETVVDGFTLRYLAGAAVSTVPTNISYSVSGNQLTLSWPADHTGWSLLMQTNHLATGISTNTNDWARVANSASTNQVTVTINPAKQTEFYRLVYP